MSRLRELVAQWVERADEDFLTAVRLLDDQDKRFRRAIVYHAQQAAEKYLKALLARHQIEIEKTHVIGRLLRRVAGVYPELAASLSDADELTQFVAETRYPGDTTELLPGAERDAVELARRVRDAVIPVLTPFLETTEPPTAH
jgi:HEPN domain-containing protein